jgi:Pyruvate:ferredoxin oxidoreductase and related 2-oxoacid:ferredoxin oxidoreductases, gamma subunit
VKNPLNNVFVFAHIVVNVINVSVHYLMQQQVDRMATDFTWMIGGPQGSGVETAANIFSQVFSKMGYQIFWKT